MVPAKIHVVFHFHKTSKYRLYILFVLALFFMQNLSAKKAYKILIISGQNNHDWKRSHLFLKKIFDSSPLFKADILLTPPEQGDMNLFNPCFSKYDAVVLDYCGDNWTEKTQTEFEEYMKKGGGLVVIHAANNSFPEWKAFNRMTAIGGWGNRNEKSGPYIYWDNDKVQHDYSPGIGGSHGPKCDFWVESRNTQHPIMRGLPEKWLRQNDELYDRLRGPGEKMEILATAFSEHSGRHEPMLLTVRYAKGRVFHCVYGHVWSGDPNSKSLESVDFVTLVLRGCEWTASGKVTQSIPEDFPTARQATYSQTLKADN